jgi:hypothetical protein
MTDISDASSKPKTKAEYEVTVRWMLEEMERMNARMDQDREEIERLKAETRSALAGIGIPI